MDFDGRRGVSRDLDFQLFMPEGYWTQIVIAGQQLMSSELPGSEKLESAKFVEPCAWCWRPIALS